MPEEFNRMICTIASSPEVVLPAMQRAGRQICLPAV